MNAGAGSSRGAIRPLVLLIVPPVQPVVMAFVQVPPVPRTRKPPGLFAAEVFDETNAVRGHVTARRVDGRELDVERRAITDGLTRDLDGCVVGRR